MADHSKFNRQVFMHLCDMSDIHTFITDKLELEEQEKLDQLGVRVLVAEKGRHRRPEPPNPPQTE